MRRFFSSLAALAIPAASFVIMGCQDMTPTYDRFAVAVKLVDSSRDARFVVKVSEIQVEFDGASIPQKAGVTYLPLRDAIVNPTESDYQSSYFSETSFFDSLAFDEWNGKWGYPQYRDVQYDGVNPTKAKVRVTFERGHDTYVYEGEAPVETTVKKDDLDGQHLYTYPDNGRCSSTLESSSDSEHECHVYFNVDDIVRRVVTVDLKQARAL